VHVTEGYITHMDYLVMALTRAVSEAE